MHRFASALMLLFFVWPHGASAAASSLPQNFSDVPPSREEYLAVEELKQRGIIEGRPDGTFGPDTFVNRAEAITIIVRAVANIKNLPSLKDCFSDVRGDAWYVTYVCYAKDLEWVAGYPDPEKDPSDWTFQPIRTVSKVEFLKILFHAYGVDTDPLKAFAAPLASDALDSSEWYIPYMSFALASSMTREDALGHLNPGAALTRGQVALLMYRYLLYRDGQRTQEVLTNAERNVRLVLTLLGNNDAVEAHYATARLRIMVWGAQQREPEAPVVRTVVKIGEALRALLQGYDLSRGGDLPNALEKTKEAYGLAGEADGLSQSDVHTYTDAIRSYAHELANAIRAFQDTQSQ